jgi:uncharacterized delta-60 repeat protein
MRALLAGLGLIVSGCTPTFFDEPCYGPGECVSGFICVSRQCLPEPDAAVDAAPPDAAPIPSATLDPNFGTVELPVTGFTVARTTPTANGGLLLSGAFKASRERADLGLVQLDASGALVTTFGTDGVLRLNYAPITTAMDVAIQPDGQRVVVGTLGQVGATDLFALRLDPTGRPDPTFGVDGLRIVEGVTAVGQGTDAQTVALLPSGRILIVGKSTRATRDGDGLEWGLLAVQLRSDGSLDTSFGDGGVYIDPAPQGGSMYGDLLSVGDDGHAIVSGGCVSTASKLCVAQLTPDGAPDPRFGIAGFSRLPVTGANNIVPTRLARDGENTLVAGRGSATFLARLDADGELDPTFGAAGIWIGPPSWAADLARACDGWALPLGDLDTFRIHRFDDDGRPHPRYRVNPIELPRFERLAAHADGWLGIISSGGSLTLTRLTTPCAP